MGKRGFVATGRVGEYHKGRREAEKAAAAADEHVKRIDRYTIEVDGHRVRAGTETEATIRSMDDAVRARFLAVMGKV